MLGEACFEATSYVWGSSIKDEEIMCGEQAIAITINLSIVLRSVRTNIPRVLWANSICIDQDDPDVGARQIVIMGQIYRAATNVLIFLGADDFGHGQNVRSLLREMDRYIKSGLEYAGTTAGAFPRMEDNAPLLKDPRFESFGHMLSQAWFQRGWVRYAVVSSNHTVTDPMIIGRPRGSGRTKWCVVLGPTSAQLGTDNSNLPLDEFSSTYSTKDDPFPYPCT